MTIFQQIAIPAINFWDLLRTLAEEQDSGSKLQSIGQDLALYHSQYHLGSRELRVFFPENVRALFVGTVSPPFHLLSTFWFEHVFYF